MFYEKISGFRQDAYRSKFSNLWAITLWVCILIEKVDERKSLREVHQNNWC